MPRCSRARPSRPGGPLYGGTRAAKSIAQPTQRPQRKQADHDCGPRVSDEKNEFANPGPFFCRDCGSAIGAGLPAEAPPATPMRPKLTRRPRNTPPNGPRSTPSSPPCRTKNSPCSETQDHFFVVIAGRRSVRGCLPRRRRPPHEAQTDSQTTKYSSQWAAEHALITPLPDKKFALLRNRRGGTSGSGRGLIGW